MSKKNIQKFTEKHPGKSPDPKIEAELLKENVSGELPCALAFNIAARLGLPAAEVGITGDLLNIKICKCQLGLFGYQPAHKLVSDKKAPTDEIREALAAAQSDNRIFCETAWEIASRLKVGKIAIGNACEAMGIKVKHCQIGAF